MKIRYYVGDAIIPWWVEKLVDRGLITEVRENAAITFILTFKRSPTDTSQNYLYDGDFLELDEDTGSVTIGYAEWDTALAADFRKQNWSKFVATLRKTEEDREKAEELNNLYSAMGKI